MSADTANATNNASNGAVTISAREASESQKITALVATIPRKNSSRNRISFLEISSRAMIKPMQNAPMTKIFKVPAMYRKKCSR